MGFFLRGPVATVLAGLTPWIAGFPSVGLASQDPPLLIEAAKRGDLAEVSRLLADGADPNARDRHNNTALTFAARDGHLDMARRLLSAGADVGPIDDEGVTPLILAAFKNHPEIAFLLLDKGADASVRDQWGRRALDYALRRGPEDPIARRLKDLAP